MKILVIAHPRSGTGYAAKSLQSIGYDVGHERLHKNGISSWLWAADCYKGAQWGDNYRDISPDVTILLKRNPYDVVASMAFTASRALPWMGQYIDIPEGDTVTRCAYSLLRWTELCLKRKPNFIVNLPDFPNVCQNVFGKAPDKIDGYNSRVHRRLTAKEMDGIRTIVEQYNAIY